MPVLRRRGLDATGLALAGALAVWAVVSSAGRPGARPLPFIGAIVLAVVAFVAGRRLVRWASVAPGAAVIAVALLAFLARPESVNEAGGGVLRYANANAALFGIAAIGALSLRAASDRLEIDPPVALTVVAGFVVLTAITASVAGIVALVAGLVVVVLGGRVAGPLALVLIVLAFAITAAIGAGTPRTGDDDFAVRTRLWHEAVRLADTDPVRGIGPGRFAALTTVSRDRDLRWAHDEYLQTYAELGSVGLVLVLLLVGWAAVRLMVAARFHQSFAAWGAGALACTGLHASVDYVAHFPVVVFVTALMVGAGATDRHPARESPG